jgi:hypothetical protein
MSEMKSAWEKALEKVEKLGKLSEEELKQLEYQPAGNKLAAKYLQEMDYGLDAEMMKYKGTGVRKYILQGAQEIFLHSMVLPKNEYDMQTTRRAMSGLRLLKENKKLLDTVLDRITNLLNYYAQARQQTYLQFKKDFEAKLREHNQAMQQHLGAKANIEPEQHPQFIEEWRRISSQLDTQYEKALEEHKQQILKIT